MARLFRLRGEQDRLWVELPVASADVQRGVNTRTPGLKLFTGLWYGKDPLDPRNYGKILEPGDAFPVGHLNARTPQRVIDRLK